MISEKLKIDFDNLKVFEEHCLPQSEIDELNRVANEAASKANDSVSDEMIENNEEISFNIDDFPENDKAFSAAMFKFADRFRDNDDIEVRYAKIENEEGIIKPSFTIRNLPLIAKHKEEERLAAELAAKEAKNKHFLTSRINIIVKNNKWFKL